jgi:alpha-tubulin suppressor-like RCC1 family protein
MSGGLQLTNVADESFKVIAAGNVLALAIRTTGTVTRWGNGIGGALAPPMHVKFKAVSAGQGFSPGLSTDGTLWGWGTPFKSPFAAHGWRCPKADGQAPAVNDAQESR